jgi:hypothetical protein
MINNTNGSIIMIVTFDFDFTLKLFSKDTKNKPNNVILKKFLIHMNQNDIIHIVTSRISSKQNIKEIEEFLYFHRLKVSSINFTDHQLKVDTLKQLKSDLHYDDDTAEIDACERNNIKFVDSFTREAERSYNEWLEEDFA